MLPTARPPSYLQSGIALVLVLWVLSLLTIMGGSFALSMRRESAIVAGDKDNAIAMNIAESGLAIAELMLLDDNPIRRWHTDGSIYEIDYPNTVNDSRNTEGGWKIRIRLISESGKVDINAADEQALQNLLRNAPVTQQDQNSLVDAILDWRDSDDMIHLNGAEKNEYAKAGFNYQPSNKPFKSIEELQWVMGMNDDVYQWLEPLITVHSGAAQIDLQKALPEVLESVANLDSDLVTNYVTSRVNNAKNDLPPPPLPAANSATPSSAVSTSESVTLLIEAIMDDGSDMDHNDNLGVVLNVLVKQLGTNASPPFMVFKWQRNTTLDVSLFSGAMDEFLVKQYAEYQFNN